MKHSSHRHYYTHVCTVVNMYIHVYNMYNMTMEGLAGETPSCWSDLIWGQHTVIILTVIMIIMIIFQMAESNRSMLCT